MRATSSAKSGEGISFYLKLATAHKRAAYLPHTELCLACLILTLEGYKLALLNVLLIENASALLILLCELFCFASFCFPRETVLASCSRCSRVS